VIIGNVSGVSDEDNTRLEAQAVVTRTQVKQQVKPIKPLKVIENLGEDVTREKLITLQGQDPSLTKFIKEAEQNQKARSSEDEGWNFCTGTVEILKGVRFLK